MPSKFTAETIDRCLMAVVSWAGNYTAAKRALDTEGHDCPSVASLAHWCKETHAARYQELREKYSAQMEAQLIGDMRDMVMLASEVERAALGKALERLEQGRDQDPARTAASASRVKQTNTDKMLSLSGRPTSIREDRNVEEILRSLAAKGIIELPPDDVQDEPKEIAA